MALMLATIISIASPTSAHNHTIKDHPRVWRCASKYDWTKVGQRPRLLKCLARSFDPPGTPAYALDIAYCESGPDLQDTVWDRYIGTYQHISSAWHDRWEKLGKPLALPSGGTNVLSQIVVSVRMAKQIGTWEGQWSCA